MGKVIFGQEIRSNIDTRVDTSDGDALANDVASGKVFYNSGGRQVGTLTTKSKVEELLEAGESVTIEAGTYTEDSIVSAKTLEQETGDADAIASDIKKDKTAYVNGEKVVGTFEELDTSDATATSNHILYGRTAYVNGEKITGVIPYRESGRVDSLSISQKSSYLSLSIRTGNYYTMPETSFNISIYNLTPGNIRSGVSVGVGTGNYIEGSFTEDATALKQHILKGKTAGINGSMQTGNMPDRSKTDVAGGDADTYREGTSEAMTKGLSSSTGELDGEDYMAIKVPYGYYNESWVYVKLSDLISDLNISPNIILEGNSILGVEGNIKSILSDGTTLSENNMSNIIKSNLAYYTENSDGEKRVCIRLNNSGVVSAGDCVAIPESTLVELLGVEADKLLESETVLGVQGTAKQAQVVGLYHNSNFEGESFDLSLANASAFDYIRIDAISYTNRFGSLLLNNTQLKNIKEGMSCGFMDRGEEIISVEGTSTGVRISTIFGYGFNVEGLKNIDNE